MTEKEMKGARRKVRALKDMLSGLEPDKWKVGVEEQTEEFFLDRSKAVVYAYATVAGRKVMDFIVTAKQDLPEILEYLQTLEKRVGEQQKLINKQGMWICDLQDEIDENC